jgi:phenylpyruvate tautomerase PptA (4-oxalocrotonate tautomerase family)
MRRVESRLLLAQSSKVDHSREAPLCSCEALTPKQKEEIVTRTTELYVELYGERARATTMVLIEEVPMAAGASPATC